jgi:hypothetical protein
MEVWKWQERKDEQVLVDHELQGKGVQVQSAAQCRVWVHLLENAKHGSPKQV